MQKRVAAIHDISCFGKCSLTVALPILSAVGIETSVIPTAVLSTHTGGFSGFTYRDLTADILSIVSHWQTLDIQFNSIYTGFLGSFEQIDIVCETFRRLKNKDTIILVDPVMADNGQLYKVFNSNFPAGMRKVCALADVIVPNMTEAALLLGIPYEEGPYTQECIKTLLQRLSELGPKQVVLTGVYFDMENLGVAAYDRDTDTVSYAFSGRIEGSYHGTGDVFASALLGALLNGQTIQEAAQLAVDFTVCSIARTRASETDVRFGVNFEEGLPMLLQRLQLV